MRSNQLGVRLGSLGWCDWRNVVGRHVESFSFGDPIETKAHAFEHCRYDESELRIQEQAGTEIRVVGTAQGDLDGVGIDPIGVESWLRFAGIYVQPSVVPRSVDEARGILAEFTDPSGLVGTPNARNCVFTSE